MNMTATETKKFAEDLKKIMPRAKWCDTLICVPACNISTAMKAFKDLRISVGAENVYFEEKGAYTGEVSADMLKDLGVKYVIVGHYEPIWAIGTGKTATAEQAGEVCSNIRAAIRGLYGARVARSVTIQYGGSMNPKNAAELLAQPDIDGGLIGGAALKPEQFVDIINAANQE